MAESLSFTVSVLAFAVSLVTAWLTLLRRGTVKMTQPTLIYFGPDGSRLDGEPTRPKVFLRTLLFSTAKRGRVIQNIYVTLSRNESRLNFNIWVYGDDTLVRGSGLFVGETGIAVNHHFLAPPDGNSFRFLEGRYQLQVWIHVLGESNAEKLFEQTLEVSREMAIALEDSHTGVYFDWGPDSSRYLSHVEKRPPSPDPRKFLEMIGIK